MVELKLVYKQKNNMDCQNNCSHFCALWPNTNPNQLHRDEENICKSGYSKEGLHVWLKQKYDHEQQRPFFTWRSCYQHLVYKPQGLIQTLAGGLVPQSRLHHFKHVLIGATHELLVCSNSDLGILLGEAVQLQQHRPLKEGNCCQSPMLDCLSPLHLQLNSS